MQVRQVGNFLLLSICLHSGMRMKSLQTKTGKRERNTKPFTPVLGRMKKTKKKSLWEPLLILKQLRNYMLYKKEE